MKRDLQAVIATRANINIAQIENYGGETFLSEELAITILQDAKLAFQRCALVSYFLSCVVNIISFIILVVATRREITERNSNFRQTLKLFTIRAC